jgi:hypothetical protein
LFVGIRSSLFEGEWIRTKNRNEIPGLFSLGIRSQREIQSLRDHEETKKSSMQVEDFLFVGIRSSLFEDEWMQTKNRNEIPGLFSLGIRRQGEI